MVFIEMIIGQYFLSVTRFRRCSILPLAKSTKETKPFIYRENLSDVQGVLTIVNEELTMVFGVLHLCQRSALFGRSINSSDTHLKIPNNS